MLLGNALNYFVIVFYRVVMPTAFENRLNGRIIPNYAVKEKSNFVAKAISKYT
jgi:hypothetical protein